MDLEPGTYEVKGLGQDLPQLIDLSEYRITIEFDADYDWQELGDTTLFHVSYKDWVFGEILVKVGLDYLKFSLQESLENEDIYIWDTGIVQSLEHEIGHSVFAIMREAFDNAWVLNNGELDHILEEYYMQIYSDLQKQLRDHIRLLTYDL